MPDAPPLTRPRQSWWLLPFHLLAVGLGIFRLVAGSPWVGGLLLTFGVLGLVSFVISRLAARREAANWEAAAGMFDAVAGHRVADGHAVLDGGSIHSELVGESDGASRYYLVTTTTLPEATLPDVAGAWHVRADAGTPPDALLDRHRHAVKSAMLKFPELSPRDADDPAATLARVRALRANELRETGQSPHLPDAAGSA